MPSHLSRRRFLEMSSAALGLAALRGAPSIGAAEPGRKLAVGVMGLGRGMGHLESYLSLPQVEVAYVCEVDQARLSAGEKAVEGKTGKRPQAVKDFRRILDDKAVDILSIAAPNFWHAPATILACAAGKH